MSITPNTICSNPRNRKSAKQFCSIYDKIFVLGNLSKWAIFLGIGLLIFIKCAGLLGCQSKNGMAFLFSPTVFISLISSGISVIMQMLIFLYGVYLFVAIAFSILQSILVEGLGIIMILLSLTMFVMAFFATKKLEIVVLGKECCRSDQKQIFDFVDNIVQQCSSLNIDHLVIGVGPVHFVTSATVKLFGVKKKLRGKTLFLSLSLLKALDVDELKSILVCELGLYKEKNEIYSSWFLPVYTRVNEILDSFSLSFGKDEQEDGRKIFFVPACMILQFCTDVFEKGERAFSAITKEGIDQLALSLTSPRSFLSAFLKTTLSLNEIDFNENKSKKCLNDMLGKCILYPTHQHLSLGERLKVLNIDVSKVTLDGVIAVTNPSTILINDYKLLESELNVLEISMKNDSVFYKNIIKTTYGYKTKINVIDL